MNYVDPGEAAEGERLLDDGKARGDHRLAGNNGSQRRDDEHRPVHWIWNRTVVGIADVFRVLN